MANPFKNVGGFTFIRQGFSASFNVFWDLEFSKAKVCQYRNSNIDSLYSSSFENLSKRNKTFQKSIKCNLKIHFNDELFIYTTQMSGNLYNRLTFPISRKYYQSVMRELSKTMLSSNDFGFDFIENCMTIVTK